MLSDAEQQRLTEIEARLRNEDPIGFYRLAAHPRPDAFRVATENRGGENTFDTL